MKLVKLSLAAVTVASLSVNAFAADSLQGMFKNGKASGQLKAYYFSKDNGTKTGSIFTPGAVLNFKTDTFVGFSGGLTFQGNSVHADATGKSIYNGDMNGEGGQLSQAYLQYANSGAFLKVGRQYISTPLVHGSGSRITKQSFEGYVAGYTGLPKTVIAAGYVTKFQGRTDGSGHIAQFNDIGQGNGAYTVFAINKSVPGLRLTAAYANVNKLSNTAGDYALWYGDINYHIPMNGVTLRAGANYYNGQTDNSAIIDSDAYSVMIGANVSGFDVQAAYGEVGSKTGMSYGLGGGAGHNNLYNTSLGYSDVESHAGAKNANIVAQYDLSKAGIAGAKIGVDYHQVNRVASSDYNIFGAKASYKFAGTLKGLKTVAMYQANNYDSSNDTNKLRLEVIYSF